MSRVRAHVYITGRVQGVMFRESTRREAHARGSSGLVRTLTDGRVEAIFEGQEPDVRAMIQWCHRGPSRARVDNVQVEWETPADEYHRFEIDEGWNW